MPDAKGHDSRAGVVLNANGETRCEGRNDKSLCAVRAKEKTVGRSTGTEASDRNERKSRGEREREDRDGRGVRGFLVAVGRMYTRATT